MSRSAKRSRLVGRKCPVNSNPAGKSLLAHKNRVDRHLAGKCLAGTRILPARASRNPDPALMRTCRSWALAQAATSAVGRALARQLHMRG